MKKEEEGGGRKAEWRRRKLGQGDYGWAHKVSVRSIMYTRNIMWNMQKSVDYVKAERIIDMYAYVSAGLRLFVAGTQYF